MPATTAGLPWICLEALDEIADPGMSGIPSAAGALQFPQAF